MWELDCEESWAPKNWCFWTVMLEKTLESPMDCKEVQSVHSKGDQSWVFIGRTDAKAETLIFGHLMWRVDSLEKTLMRGGIGGRRRRGWQRMRWLDGHEFEWTPGVGDGQGGLACCDSWGRKESDTTEQLNWTECFDQRSFLILILKLTLINDLDRNGHKHRVEPIITSYALASYSSWFLPHWLGPVLTDHLWLLVDLSYSM